MVIDMTTFRRWRARLHLNRIREAMDRVRAAKKPVLTFALGYADDHMLLAGSCQPRYGSIHRAPRWCAGRAAVSCSSAICSKKSVSLPGSIARANTNRLPSPIRATPSPTRHVGIWARWFSALWEEWQANVKKARPKADLAQVTGDITGWIDAAGGDLATAAIRAGLVDKLGDRVEFGARVAKIAGEDRLNDKPGAFAASDFDAFLADLGSERGGKAIGVSDHRRPDRRWRGGPRSRWRNPDRGSARRGARR